ncbi:FKBP-type peptidyl-prolyl cis-trans isomerase [Daejeonella sp.]|uniref:FKBP-type peptidyl-prolyl cis-trans isomerase n=1 Tax=Daejeonella sp. TaxID=2805397 RepID=UPI0030C37FFB
MKKIVTCFLGLITLFFGACSEYQKGNGILLYKIVDGKNTPTIGKIAVVFLTYSEATDNGKVLSETGIFDPIPLEVYATTPQFEGDFQDAFQYLSEGDSAVVKVSLDSIKLLNPTPILAKDSSKYMTYKVRIHKVINQNGKGDSTFLTSLYEYKNEEILKRKTAEPEKIERYLTAKKLKYTKTSTGLLYPSDLKTVNNSGKELYVSYAFTSLDGKLFLRKYEKIKPEQAHIPGLKEALTITPKGIKTKVIIPSKLAYSAVGDNDKMSPYTPLICDFMIVNNKTK